ncbi:MAG: hypothetical protein AB7H77_05685 [Bdellovibrionales bacterium]
MLKSHLVCFGVLALLMAGPAYAEPATGNPGAASPAANQLQPTHGKNSGSRRRDPADLNRRARKQKSAEEIRARRAAQDRSRKAMRAKQLDAAPDNADAR